MRKTKDKNHCSRLQYNNRLTNYFYDRERLMKRSTDCLEENLKLNIKFFK